MNAEGLFARLAERLDQHGDSARPTFATADLLDLPSDERLVMRHIMRRADPATVGVIAQELGRDEPLIRELVTRLVERQALVTDAGRIRMATIALTRRATPGGLWDRLSDL
jgi:predicted transcriptional regulator